MKSRRKAIWGWMFFDWANQPFHTLIVTFTFAPYFAAEVAATPAEGQAIWGYAMTAGALIIAALAPILGALADASGPRRPWILGFSAIYVVGVAGLWVAEPGGGTIALTLAFLILALIGAEFATVFTNSLLPELAPKEEIGRISGSGWAMGYWGGLTILLIVLGFVAPIPGADTTMLGLSPVFGLDPGAGEGARATGPLAAIWYLIFMIPFFLWTPDAPRRAQTPGAVAKALSDLKRSLASLPSKRSLFSYLLSSMFYRDALGGLFVFGGIYAAGVLEWGTFQLGVFGIIAAGAGAVGAWIGGLSDQRFGPKPVIVAAILMLMCVAAVTLTTTQTSVLFIPVGTSDAPSSLPGLVFYFCGSVIGGAGGSLLAASRTMLVRQAEPGKMGEAFGVYALAGKATSFLAPAAIAIVTDITDDQAIGVTPVLVLFAIGLLLMIRVSPDGYDGGYDGGAGDDERALRGGRAVAT